MSRLLLALLLVVLAAGPPVAAAQSTSRLVGRVVDGITGEPVAGARLMIFTAPTTAPGVLPPPPVLPPPSTQASASRPPGPQLPPSTMTNANGMFEMRGVPPGRWGLRVMKDGYITVGQFPSQLIVEASGPNVAVPDIRLDRGGVITGRILDVKGNTLSGLLVMTQQLIRSRDGVMRQIAPAVQSFTNDLGEYRLAGVQPGQHVVYVQLPPPMRRGPPPRSDVVVLTTYYPGFADATMASPIAVVGGTTTNGIDFPMLSVPAYQVSGKAVNADGRPLAGVIVQLSQRGRNSFELLESAETGSDGTFRIVNVPSGAYRAIVGIPVVQRSPAGGTARSVNYRAGSETPTEVVVEGNDVGGLQVVRR